MALDALQEELEVWDRALRAFDVKNYETALTTFELFSYTSTIVTNIGLIRVLQGKYELATKSFSDAIELDRFLAIAFFQRGVCYLHLKLFEKASEDFGETQIKLRGNTCINYEVLGLRFILHSAEVLFNWAKALVHVGRKEEGATYLQRAISACSEERHARIKHASATSIGDMKPFAVVSLLEWFLPPFSSLTRYL
ncbi:TPR-like protein [Dendrothele bispora CBS 962.96]|uniref:TPR-like protein n=1 Tax=Dendrothele bispora (strain CBS 962.96) TaxID=1314807 RepID=A0A4S8LWS6_DENBC|nr:TPR-like protein [Dendrothele bispora CBS 962.96]